MASSRGSRQGCGSDGVVLGDALKELVEVVSGEGPVEGCGRVVVVVFEVGQASGDLVQIEKVVGVDDLALNEREDDLDLVEPGSVNGQMDQPQIGPGALRRSIEACPRWLLLLSTTQNTRLADA
jgi:hypothetical protein